MKTARVLVCLCAAAAGLAGSARADSTSSVASSAASASIGSVSDSVQSVSRSSAGPRVAQGEYRIVAVQPEPAPDVRAHLTLQGTPGDFALRLPWTLVERHGLGVGTVVRVSNERFGLVFSLPHEAQPFFLALDGAFSHELDNRPVRL